MHLPETIPTQQHPAAEKEQSNAARGQHCSPHECARELTREEHEASERKGVSNGAQTDKDPEGFHSRIGRRMSGVDFRQGVTAEKPS